MPIADVPNENYTATEASCDIRKKLGSVVSVADVNLRQIRSIVRAFGRQSIASELGADGGDLFSIYNSLKAAVETATGRTVEDLP